MRGCGPRYCDALALRRVVCLGERKEGSSSGRQTLDERVASHSLRLLHSSLGTSSSVHLHVITTTSSSPSLLAINRDYPELVVARLPRDRSSPSLLFLYTSPLFPPSSPCLVRRYSYIVLIGWQPCRCMRSSPRSLLLSPLRLPLPVENSPSRLRSPMYTRANHVHYRNVSSHTPKMLVSVSLDQLSRSKSRSPPLISPTSLMHGLGT
jgi:hypothetical protein